MSQSQKQLYFYSPEGLALVKNTGTGATVMLRAAGQTLAQRDDVQTALYAADLQGSVLRCIGRSSSNLMQYMVYGWDSQGADASLLRFTGQRKETITGHYLLGDGYRPHSPWLMRFIAPDNLSPFDAGGLNAYSYCGGDPVNRIDPSGHAHRKFSKAVITTKQAPPLRRAFSAPSLAPRKPVDWAIELADNDPKIAHHVQQAFDAEKARRAPTVEQKFVVEMAHDIMQLDLKNLEYYETLIPPEAEYAISVHPAKMLKHLKSVMEHPIAELSWLKRQHDSYAKKVAEVRK